MATTNSTGLNVDALVPQAIRPRHAEFRRGYAQAPRSRPMGLQMELVALRKDGSEVMVEIALSPLQDQGQPFVVAAIRDIAAYPRVQQALQRARYSEHLAQLGRLAVDERDPQVVLDARPGGRGRGACRPTPRWSSCSTATASSSAWSAASACSTANTSACACPTSPTPCPATCCSRAAAVAVPESATEQRLRAAGALRGGRHAGDAGGAAVRPRPHHRRGGGVLAPAQRFGADEQRFLESLSNLLATCLQRAQSEDALKHAQRLESVGQLTGGIAHDFNNLLTVIQGNLQVLEELPALADDAYGQQLVAAATRASRRGAELTGKLLAFSRRQVLQPSSLNVGQLLHSLADMLRRTLDQRIHIEVDVAPDCPPVLADPGQLESALLNIAINARDAMREGGTLRFAAQPCSALPAEVRNNLDDPSAPEDGFVAIAISDTGSGMPEAVKQRAFEPFFTTKEAGRGTGLGLSTVYGFVRQSQGRAVRWTAPPTPAPR